MEFVNVKVSSLHLATSQLERSISLYLNERDFISALTLAGAAEEILGKTLSTKGRQNAMDLIKAEHRQMWEIIGGNPPPDSQVVNFVNLFRNYYKHLLSEIGEKEMTISIDFYSAEMIYRAIFNYEALVGASLECIGEFKAACAYKNLEHSPPNHSFKADPLRGRP